MRAVRTRALGLFLGLSLGLNLFLVLWNSAADLVVRVDRATIERHLREARAGTANSAFWDTVLIDSPNLVIVEHGDLANFRGLFGPHVQRRIYLWAPRPRHSR